MAGRERFGEFLLRHGILSREAISAILEEQRLVRAPFGQIAVRRGYLDEISLTEQLSHFTGIPLLQSDTISDDAALTAKIPKKLARKLGILPLGRGLKNELVCACNGPVAMAALQSVSKLVNRPVTLQMVPSSQLTKMLSDSMSRDFDTSIQVRDLRLFDENVNLVTELLEKLLLRAINMESSDIHLEPGCDEMKVRFRIDGMLKEVEHLPIALADKVLSRIKVLAGLDIAEKRMPQDGAFFFVPQRLDIEIGGVNIRTSTLPVIYGEKAVLRLLPSNDSVIGIGEIGMNADTLERFTSLAARPHGILLVTGPTGSGKSTTLYGLLQMLRDETRNITTLEDPVEVKMAGINQTQITAGPKISFAGALRSILRQDPDIIMVGEIRDKDTIDVSLQASITGHLVLSTLHTNDAPSSFTRLLDMGAESFLVATSIRGILAQRLVRRVCPICACEEMITDQELAMLQIPDAQPFTIQRGQGCDRCHGSGYTGRLGLFELLVMDEQLKQMVARRDSAEQLLCYALQEQQFQTLRMDGLEKVRQGLTTPEEIMRVTMD
ncbi:ATPase, T2SS/T4P/T4SS family [uncultured Desulfuromonas sp.]|uniref:GspE/PulE family protein n=1 Tax=uncultured Desulfuromonas sp. TaxID=181013 RepID=UPI002AAAE552|nr:ATPase, T2SS/T4P/T4SS family [uncultured Desulfuromonas sp.]